MTLPDKTKSDENGPPKKNKRPKSKCRLQAMHNKLRNFTLYQTEQWFYLVGCDNAKKRYRILKIDRSREDELRVYTDPIEYSTEEMQQLLIMMDEGNKTRVSKKDSSGAYQGLRTVLKAFGLVGFIKFTQGYYMILITQRRKVGQIGSNHIFEIRKTAFIPLSKKYQSSPQQVKLFQQEDEKRYKDIFLSLDLTKDFYFSYTYDLTQTLQHNMTKKSNVEDDSSFTNMFVWNSYLLKPVKDTLDRSWILPIVHGHFGQSCVSIFGRVINIVLLARRSRYFAGTRYLKRGISDSGHVANHVETEQIVFDSDKLWNQQSEGYFSSIVQTRGSIPLYWSQTISTKVVNPKPDIVLGKFDPIYKSARKHFEEFFERYGFPVICLDLTRRGEKKIREEVLGRGYQNCIEFLNKSLAKEEQIKYISLDFRQKSETPEKLLNEFSVMSEEIMKSTSFFCTGFHGQEGEPKMQSGVLRTNCIDCLDRTNIAQFFLGKYALGMQLHALGITEDPHLINSTAVRCLMTLYTELGDKIALQYGGSQMVSAGMHHRGFAWDVITSIRRYYSNNFKDENKQHAMNLFLGNFVPGQGDLPNLWDLQTDHYLHSSNRELYTPLREKSMEFLTQKEDITDDKPEKPYRILPNQKDIFFEEYYDTNNITAMTKFFPTSHMVPKSKDQQNYKKIVLQSLEGKITEPTMLFSLVDIETFPKHFATYWKERCDSEPNPFGIDPKHIQPTEKDTALYQRYTTEFTRKEGQQQYRAIIRKESHEIYKSYSSYIAGNERMELSIPKKDKDLYTEYCSKSLHFNVYEKVKEFADSISNAENILIGNKKDENDMNYEFFGPHYREMKKFFPYSDNQTIAKKVEAIIDQLKKELNIQNRINYERPLKKFFNQTKLHDLLKGELYTKCFVGSEAVDYVLQHSLTDIQLNSREDATQFLQVLLNANVFHHVGYLPKFLDELQLYRFIDHDPIRVLNMEHTWMKNSRHPCQVSASLLTQIVEVYRALIPGGKNDYIAYNFRHKFDLQKMLNYKPYLKYVEATAELQRLDISSLSREESIVFFVNIFNALFIHAAMLAGGDIVGQIRYSFYSTNCYQIGGYLFSLADIKHGILRGNKRPPRCFTQVFRPQNGRNDPRVAFAISPLEVRTHFLLCTSTRPVFTVLNTETLEEALEKAAEDYLVLRICVDVNASELILPQLIDDYRGDFGNNTDQIILKVSEMVSHAEYLHNLLIKLFDSSRKVTLKFS